MSSSPTYFLLIFLNVLLFSTHAVIQKESHVLSKTNVEVELEKVIEDNFKPIIVVVSIPHNKTRKSVISTDIVRFIEEGGARVLPIHYKTPWETVKNLLNQVNGVVFQGGGPKHWPQNEIPQHFNLQWQIFKYAIEENEKGIYFPVLGICLGFQRLLEFSALWYTGQQNLTVKTRDEVYNIRDKYFGVSKVDSEYHAANLEMLTNNSILFNQSVETVQRYDMNDSKKLFFLNNQFGLDELVLDNIHLFNGSWNLVAKTQDYEGKWFVGAVEHAKYPFFGTQIHPEKVQFDSNDFLNKITENNHISYIPSNEEAIRVNSRIALNFVLECKKNKNRFNDSKEYEPKLIDNYRTYIHRGGDINCYYGIGKKFKEFDEMRTALPQLKSKLYQKSQK